MFIQKVGAAKTVGRLGHVKVNKCTEMNKPSPRNAVNPEEITTLFVKIPMEMAGTEDILKLVGTNTASNSIVAKRKKKRQLTPMEVISISDSFSPI